MSPLFDSLSNPSVVVALTCVILASFYIIRKYFSDAKEPNLTDRFVLITGCDSGFGRMAAIRLDKLGFQVLAACFTNEGENSIAKDCSKRIKTFLLDVTKTEQVKDVYLKVKALIPHDKGNFNFLCFC
jgi:retinol dehydrogenase-16